MGLRPISMMSGSNAIRGYDDNGIVYGVNPVREYILIDTGEILQNQHKIIDLTLLGYDVAIDSIWVLATNNNVGDVKIQITDTNENELHHITVEQDNNRSVCCSPPFLVLDPRYRLKISPERNVKNILIYCHRVYRINYLGITDQ